MFRNLVLWGLVFVLGCGGSEFVVVGVENGGKQAPEFDKVEVSVSGEIDGQRVEKSFSLDNPDQRELPISFFLEFDSQHAGLEIALRVIGEKNGAEVFEANGSAVVGKETSLPAVFCGDGIPQTERGEICDDGNRANGDGCRDDCTEEECGDGRLDPQEECDDSNNNEGDGCRGDCTEEQCGDSILDIGEFCDDGNGIDNDGCDNDCSAPEILQLVAGDDHTCVLVEGGFVKCWGEGASGRLGYGNQNTIGDDELPSAVGFVDVGGKVVQISAGAFHTCALLDTGKIRCWGFNSFGQLGYGNTNNIGDDELPSSVGDVDLGSGLLATQVSAGGEHTCALLAGGSVKCWGRNNKGQLGYGNTTNIGDNEAPASVGAVNVGDTVLRVEAGGAHSCSIVQTGKKIHCWGDASQGQLGYGNTNNIGDNETPASAGSVPNPLTSPVVDLSLSKNIFFGTTCARFSLGEVSCWGAGAFGNLGYGFSGAIGDNEEPRGALSLGGDSIRVSAGLAVLCSLFVGGGVRCWGLGGPALGLALNGSPSIGDDDVPADFAPIELGNDASQIAAGERHVCALLVNNSVLCWGTNTLGILGYGNRFDVGDNETPAVVGSVSLFEVRS